MKKLKIQKKKLSEIIDEYITKFKNEECQKLIYEIAKVKIS